MAQSQMVADAVASASRSSGRAGADRLRGRRQPRVPVAAGRTRRVRERSARGARGRSLRFPRALAQGPSDRAARRSGDRRDPAPRGRPRRRRHPRRNAAGCPRARGAGDRLPASYRAGPAPQPAAGHPRHPRQRRFPPRARAREGELDAVILAAAGISRLGGDLGGLHAEALGLAEWPTAPGQVLSRVETRDDIDPDIRAALAALDDEDTRVAITAERVVLNALDAGCSAPVGTHAALVDGDLRLRAVVYALDGSQRIGSTGPCVCPRGMVGKRAVAMGRMLPTTGGRSRERRERAAKPRVGCSNAGGADLVPRETTMNEGHWHTPNPTTGSVPKPLTGRRVLVPRGGPWGDGVAARLRQLGAVPVIAPLINFAPTNDQRPSTPPWPTSPRARSTGSPSPAPPRSTSCTPTRPSSPPRRRSRSSARPRRRRCRPSATASTSCPSATTPPRAWRADDRDRVRSPARC